MHFLRSRPVMLGIGVAILLIVVVAGATLVGGRRSEPSASPTPSASRSPSPSPSPSASPTPSPSPSPSPTPSPSSIAVCPMNGTELSDPELADRVPILVQIENNPIARPPSGLNLADLVIEAPVEGDTTRYAAIYQCRDTVGAAVGPVRSMRYFNLDYWQQLRVLTFNFGGAGKVLARLTNNSMPYVNGLTGSWPFYFRAGPWAAPHNVYFDVDRARAEMAEGGLLEERAEAAGEPRNAFAFDADVELPPGRAVRSIGLQTSSFWRFGWEWDPESGHWLRTDGGNPNTDAVTGDRISTRTVLVQAVRQEVLVGENDPGGFPRRYQYLVGEGDGVLFIDGQAHDVRWSRPSKWDRTAWTYADTGDPVVLPPGRIWWEIVPIGSAIVER